jgi:hypothetical protein
MVSIRQAVTGILSAGFYAVSAIPDAVFCADSHLLPKETAALTACHCTFLQPAADAGKAPEQGLSEGSGQKNGMHFFMHADAHL